jgi:hypothetical protein
MAAHVQLSMSGRFVEVLDWFFFLPDFLGKLGTRATEIM